MRVVLVGRPEERARLRAALTGTSIEVVDEESSISAARAAAALADAFIVAPSRNATGATREPGSGGDPLTPREHDVLNLLATGLPNKAIAGRLAISDQTVKFHVASICGKLGAINRTDAVRRAIERGLIAI